MNERATSKSVRRVAGQAPRFVATVLAPSHAQLPIAILSVANRREHWRKAHKRSKAQRTTVRLALDAWKHYRPRAPCTVTLTATTPYALDGDNLQRAFKAVRDEVAAWLGIDDGDERIAWSYKQRRGGVREYGCDIAWS